MSQPSFHLQRPSPDKRPGFVTFRAEDGRHYFHFNDANGQPLLFSKGYSSARSRDRALESVKNILGDPAQYQEMEARGEPYFVLRSRGNNQVIARSANFSSKQAMKQVKARLQKGATTAPTPRPQPKPKPKPLQQEPAEAAPSHYRFVLSFYPEEDGKSLRGKIEYPLVKGDRDTFEGLDLERIGAFLAQHLPGFEHGIQSKEGEEALRLEAPVTLMESGRPLKGPGFRRTSQIELEAALPPELQARLGQSRFRAEVLAKPLKESFTIRVGKLEGILARDGKIRVPLFAHKLKSNVYRLNFNLQLGQTASAPAEVTLTDSRLVQVF